MTSPIIEPIIVSLADSTLDLSPPESIHLIPPQIKRNTAITIAAMIRKVIMLLIIAPKESGFTLQSLLPPPNPCGQGFIVPWANAGSAAVSVNSDPLRRLTIVFIYLIHSKTLSDRLSIVNLKSKNMLYL